MNFAILGSRGFPSSYGGYETLVRRLAPYLEANGHSVTVYSRSAKEGSRVWDEQGVRCIATPGYDSKSLSTLSFGLTATVDASIRKFDAVLVLNIANGLWLPLLKGRRIPTALNTDGIEWERGKWSTLGKKTFLAGARTSAKMADALICDSKEIGRIWKERFGRTSEFIPYGGDLVTSSNSDYLKELNLTPDTYLLVVARLAPENNVELTLDAIDRLGTAAPPSVIVGSANFDSPIEDRLRSMEASGQVKWLGHVADQELLSELWANCMIYVHGHSVGGTNPALLQALGAGAPTLALETPFNSEVIGSSDQLFPPSADALAEKVKVLASDSGLRGELRDRGRTTIADRYSWDDVCRSYTDLLVALSQGR
jgi:glycosyltransferase involved in cell wall biosynthesis